MRLGILLDFYFFHKPWIYFFFILEIKNKYQKVCWLSEDHLKSVKKKSWHDEKLNLLNKVTMLDSKFIKLNFRIENPEWFLIETFQSPSGWFWVESNTIFIFILHGLHILIRPKTILQCFSYIIKYSPSTKQKTRWAVWWPPSYNPTWLVVESTGIVCSSVWLPRMYCDRIDDS